MARTFFSVWSLGSSQKLLKTNQFLVSTIFFTIMNISFFSLHFDLFSIIAKKVNQIRNNIVYVVARLVFLFCFALTTGRCNAFQHIFVNSKKSEFYGPYFQTMLFLVTIIYDRDLYDIWRIFYMIGTSVMKEFTKNWEILSTF